MPNSCIVLISEGNPAHPSCQPLKLRPGVGEQTRRAAKAKVRGRGQRLDLCFCCEQSFATLLTPRGAVRLGAHLPAPCPGCSPAPSGLRPQALLTLGIKIPAWRRKAALQGGVARKCYPTDGPAGIRASGTGCLSWKRSPSPGSRTSRLLEQPPAGSPAAVRHWDSMQAPELLPYTTPDLLRHQQCPVLPSEAGAC